MRYITVPESITVQPPTEQLIASAPETISFRKYAFTVWLDDRRAIDGGFVKHVRWSKVVAMFDACKPGSVLPIEDEDWSTLKAIVEKPEAGFAKATVTLQLIPYSQAVLDAATEMRSEVNGEARAS